MNKKIYIHFWLILFICLPLTIKGQAQSSISLEERMELEKKFSGLKTFYIDNDGTVVYSYGDNATAEPVPEKTKQDRVKVTVNINEEGEYVVTKEQPNYTLAEEDTRLYSIPENIQIKDDFEINEPEKTNTSSDTTGTSLGNNTDNNRANTRQKTLKRREPSKTAEETALELDDLISEYKRMQELSKRRNNSLSSRLSGGVDNNLRRDYSHILDSENTDEKDEGSEPTYYINGVEASIDEFNKLKEGDIRLKERRRNGDWWVQTK